MKTWQWISLLCICALIAGGLVYMKLEKKDRDYDWVTQQAQRIAKENSDLKVDLYRCKKNAEPT